MNFIRICLFLILTSVCVNAQAINALRGKKFTSAIQNNKRKELNLNREFVTQGKAPIITKSEMAEIMPTDLQTTQDGKLVSSRILSKAAQFFSKSSFIQNSFLMKTAKKVEKKTSLEMNIADEDTKELQPIEHKFNFDIQALKGEARLLYSGFIDSKVEYRTTNNTVQFSVEEHLSNNSKIALLHENNNQEHKQLLQYQIQW
jgi:hypothetical protein